MKKPKLKELIGNSVLYGDTLADIVDVDEDGNITLDVDGEEEVVHATELVDENDELEPYIEAYGWDEDTGGGDSGDDWEDEDTGGDDGGDDWEDEELLGDDDGLLGEEEEPEEEKEEQPKAKAQPSGVIGAALKCLQRCVSLLQSSVEEAELEEEEEETEEHEHEEEKGGTRKMGKITVRKGMKAKALYDGEWYDVEIVAKTDDGYVVTDGEYEWEVAPDELKLKRASRKKTSARSSRSAASASRKPKNAAQERMAILEELGVEEGDTIKYKSKRAKKWHKGEVVKVYTSASKFKGFVKVEDDDGNEDMVDPLKYVIKVV